MLALDCQFRCHDPIVPPRQHPDQWPEQTRSDGVPHQGAIGDTANGERVIAGVHHLAAATGFRPDLAMLSELQLYLDPDPQAPTAIGPLVDPARHTCGTVAPHGWRELAHAAEPGFFTVGMKSYGRAPPEPFAGKRVVVVGGGNTGAHLLAEGHPHSRQSVPPVPLDQCLGRPSSNS